MMKLKAVLSYLLCIALFAGLLVLPAGAAVSAVTITFDTEGGSAVAPITQDEGTVVLAPADPTWEGYEFVGWEPPVPATMPAYDSTCTAQWEENPGIGPSYIYFDSNGGTPVAPIVVGPDGMMICLPDPPTREGYAFMGWEPPIPAYGPVDDITCVAQWEPYTSIITFDSDGGSPVDQITQEEGTEVIPPADPTREGYIFMGWMPELPATMPVDDLTCVAQWDIPPDPSVCSTIHLDPGGGHWDPDPYGIDPIIINDEGGIPYLPTLTKEGYIFIGWEPQIPAYCPVEEITCVAQWEPIVVPQSTITFDSWGGSSVASITQDEGTEVTPPADPVKTGFDFIGWSPAVPAIMPEDDVTCLALWEPIIQECWIILDPNGGKWDDGSTAPREFRYVDGILVTPGWEEGLPIILPSDPTRDGYVFCGWTPFPPASYPEEEFTCYAQWEPFMSTITFDSAGGSPVDPIIQDEGTAVTPPADPTKVGYIFAGWSPAVPAIMPEDDITCTAQWNLLGDINGDGNITPLDALMALQGSTGEYVLSALQRLAADANHDGRISSMDALMLLRAASGLTTL